MTADIDPDSTREPDQIRDAIIDRARELSITAYRLAQMIDAPDASVQAYFRGTKSTSSERVAAMCRVLGLELRRADR